MKTFRFVALGVVAFAGSFAAGNAQADPRANANADRKILVQDEEERYVVVTGSYIPQKVRRKSIGTDSVHNVRIFTKRELESTGRTPSVAGGLSLDPSISISGR